MIEIKDLCVSYGNHAVLKSLNLNLEQGKIHGLAGLNGSGKSTLLNTLFGFVEPDSGSISVNGKALDTNKIGYLETQNYLYHRLKIREYVGLFARSTSSETKSFDLNGWLELFSLSGEEFTEELSTGMRKKVALLCLIAQNKEVLLLDEPFNGLDMESVLVLNLVLKELQKNGKTIVITSHIIETLLGNCDQIHTLVQGEISASYFPPDFEKLNAEFLGDFVRKAGIAVSELF